MSSAEMLTLIRNIHLLIGNFVTFEDEYWELLTLLKGIVDITTSNVVYPYSHIHLQRDISEYLKLLKKLKPNYMKPKHNFSIHYPAIMEEIGPLWRIACMRCEGKHRQGEEAAFVLKS